MADSEADHNRGLSGREYVAHRVSLVQTLHDQARSFDRAILTLSSGALGLSLVFVEKIAPHPAGWTKCFLATAWILFALAMLCTLISFLTSQACHDRLIAEWDNTYETQQDAPPDPLGRWYNAMTKRLNLAAALLFIGGVGFLTEFAIANL